MWSAGARRRALGEVMSAIEQSLRNRLESGNAASPTYRLSIYEASARALERMLAARDPDQERDDRERERLGTTIQRVEAEYGERYENDAFAEQDSVAPVGGDTFDPAPARAPASFAPPPDAGPEETAEEWRPRAGRPTAPRGRSVLPFVVGALVLVLLGVLVLYTLGVFSSPAGPAQDGAPPAAEESAAPPASLEEETAEAPAGGGLSWINVFSGGELDRLSTPDGGRVEAVSEEERAAVRLAAPQGTASEVLLELGQGLVNRIAGSTVRIELTAGSPDDALREFSVRCVFGEASICDRQRFVTDMREEAFVFDVAVPAGAAGPGVLAIGPGLAAAPDLDLYSVRMRVL